MDLNELMKLAYWNGLVGTYAAELVMVLTAAVVVMLDRYLRRALGRMTTTFNVVTRFLAFLLVCSVGYAVLALGVAWTLRVGMGVDGGVYAAPVVMAVLVVVAIEAQRQKAV